jgi:hypothetical protein
VTVLVAVVSIEVDAVEVAVDVSVFVADVVAVVETEEDAVDVTVVDGEVFSQP